MLALARGQTEIGPSSCYIELTALDPPDPGHLSSSSNVRPSFAFRTTYSDCALSLLFLERA